MTLVIEDGTGLSTAVAYQDATAVLAYLQARAAHAAFAALSSAEKNACCVLATDYLQNGQRWVWRGLRYTLAQALAFPRSDVVDDDGYTRPVSPLPSELLAAHAELCAILAARKGTGTLSASLLQPVRARGGRILSQSVAGISQTFAPDAPVEEEITVVVGLLTPLLASSATSIHPYMVNAVDDDNDDLAVFNVIP